MSIVGATRSFLKVLIHVVLSSSFSIEGHPPQTLLNCDKIKFASIAFNQNEST